ncbi:Defense-related protein, partial [Zea mays]
LPPSSPPPLTPRKRVSQAKRRPTPASIPGPETRLPGRDAASHGNGAARQRRVGRAGGRRRRRRRPLAGGLVRGAAVRRGLGVRAAEVRRLLRRLPRAAGGGRREVAGVGAAPRRRGAGAVRQDPRRDVPPRRPRHGRPGPPGVQQGRPHEHRRPPPPPQPHTGLPGGSGQDELRRAAAGQGAVEQGVQGLPQGKAPVVAAARCGAIAGGNWGALDA